MMDDELSSSAAAADKDQVIAELPRVTTSVDDYQSIHPAVKKLMVKHSRWQ